MQLAVIDPSASMAAQARSMALACRADGFFRVPIAAVDQQVADQAWSDATRFFALPESLKREVEFPETGYPYGYAPFGLETLARSSDPHTTVAPDLKESLSVGPDCGPSVSHGPDEAWIRSPSLWPESPVGIRQSWTAYYLQLAALAEHLVSVMAVALELPEHYFAPLIDRPITSMRAISYPKLDPSVGGGTRNSARQASSLRAGAHSDYGTLTILRTSDVAGLEIRPRGGAWVPVDHDPNSFVVNLGDSIAQWTNDRWLSTEHRVVVGDGTPRQSFAFFHMANWDATIECVPSCLGPGGTSRHKPVQAGPWLMKKFQATVSPR